jgi:DNA polymerase
MKLHLDFETRGVLDLTEVGLHRYARDQDTDVWCMAWAIDDEEPKLWHSWDGTPQLHALTGADIYAWNAGFEYEIWNEIMAKRYGWPKLKLEQMYCTQSMANAMAFPGKMEDAAAAFGVDFQKDNEGRALMLRMTRPRAPLGKKLEEYIATREGELVWWDEPEKLARLGEYCKQDVRVERAVGERVVPLSDKERRVWLLDQKINRQGVAVDLDAAAGAVKIAEEVKVACNARLAEITGGAVLKVTAIASLKDWMTTQGVTAESLNKQAVVDMLAEDDAPVDEKLPDAVRKALLLRQESGKASNAKFEAMLRAAGADGRLRHMYYYHGASTGRWAGRLVQTHNLPRDMPPAQTIERILALVRRGDWRAIDMIYGPPLTVLSRCLRAFFKAAPGRKLISGDWSNVEGRGQAWFAGEQWKLDAYRAADAKTGPGLYELAYARMFHVPVESVKNPSEERQIGKVSELAFGYQGGVGSFRTMAKAYPEISGKITDEQADDFKRAWRAAHPSIARVWYEIQDAAINAVLHEGEEFKCGCPGRQATYRKVGSFLWCLLPSGRAICYPYPKVLEGQYGNELTYMCVPSPDDRKKGKIIYEESNSSNWVRIGTYGGSLFNNIVQGMCRDFLADLLLWLDDNGATIVMHTHDDANVEVSTATAEGARKVMEDRMRLVPEWAEGFSLFARCQIMDRYGKG